MSSLRGMMTLAIGSRSRKPLGGKAEGVTMKCYERGKEFDPADRASSTVREGSVEQIRYCSEQCARRAENCRAYQKRKARRET